MSLSKFSSVPVFKPDSSGTKDEQVPSVKKGRGKGQVYDLKMTFISKQEADNHVRSQDCWSKLTNSVTEEGSKVYYRCKTGHGSCSVSTYLLFHASDSKVSMFQNQEPHCHQEEAKNSTRGLDKEQKAMVKKLLDDRVTKPKAILSAFQNRGLNPPTLKQLNSFLGSYRRKKYGHATLNVNELLKWCQDRTQVPVNVDQPFVLSFKISMDKETGNEELGVFLTTLRLLKLSLRNTFIQTDSTYKLTWQGYPVMIVGTSDRDRAFHPFGLALCYSEKDSDFEFIFKSLKDGIRRIYGVDYNPTVLMADGADAITNGFKSVFGLDFTRLMCYFHVMKKVDEHLRSVPAENRVLIRRDIEILQLATDRAMFDQAKDLFVKKWKSKKGEQIQTFLEYFMKQWLIHLPNWYEGSASGLPSTNNSLEATNNVIKKEYTVRERLPLSQFLEIVITKILPDWSIARDPQNINCKGFAVAPSKSLDIWTKAFQWATSGMKVLSDSQNKHYVASSQYLKGGGMLTEEKIEVMSITSQNGFEDFEQFVSARTNIWCISLIPDQLENASCNCPVFLKQYQCKHSLGLCIRLKLIQAPESAKTIPLGQKRKPGRPKKARAALVVQ